MGTLRGLTTGIGGGSAIALAALLPAILMERAWTWGSRSAAPNVVIVAGP